MVLKICVLAMMLVCSITDIRKQEIPAWELCAFFALSAVGCILQFLGGDTDVVMMALSLLPGVLILLLSFITREGIGYGDGLVALFLGPALGLKCTGTGLILAFFASSVFSAVLLFTKRAGRNHRIPFVPFMTLGMGVMMFAPI